MIRGLEIRIPGEALSRRIAERIEAHESAVSGLDARITQRAGDLPFDVQPEDGFKTLSELEWERQQYRDRISQLTLLRDNLVPDERYILGRRDLRLAELISAESADAFGMSDDGAVDGWANAPIDGLRLTISGEELLTLLERPAQAHSDRAERWKRQQARTPEQRTDDVPLLPDEMCANAAERAEWRASVLRFIREHIEATEIYRLGEADLAFGELLPEPRGDLG